MTNRRQLLGVGLAASVLPFASSSLRAALVTRAPTAPDTVPLYKVLFDVRFPASVAFARRAAARGVRVRRMEADVTPFWYDDLYHRWRSGPAAIAGLTAHGALFCLERLAWDQRMRVVFRAEHIATADAVRHTVEAPRSVAAAAASALTEPAWPRAIADLVLRCPSGRAATAVTHAETACATAVDATNEPLYSWLIAPVARG